jgi:magnesium transporter
MADAQQIEPWVRIAELLAPDQADALHELLDELSPGEVARSISRLNDEQRARLLSVLDPKHAADLMEELSDFQGADIIEDLPAETAALIVDEMESGERADLLGEMDDEDAQAILERMDPEEAEDVRQLLEYDPDTAGGLMITEFLVFPQDLTVNDVFENMRRNAEEYADYHVQYAYVQSENGTLVGVLPLRDLVLSPGDTPVRNVMIVNPISVTTDTAIDELEHAFDRYMFSGLPVVGTSGELVGVVLRADVEEAQGELAEKRFMQFSGIVGGEELRSLPLVNRAFSRLRWLAVNMSLSIPSAFVILSFEHTINKTIVLAALIPVLGNMSGCSGNQAVAVSIREISLGILEPRDVLRVMRQEIGVGMINGVTLGTFLAIFAYILGGNAMLGVAVGMALSLNTMLAVMMGGAVPLVLKRFGVDPAVAAAPMLTTTSDVVGFFLILSLSTLALS